MPPDPPTRFIFYTKIKVLWWNVISFLWLAVLCLGPGMLGNRGCAKACRLLLKAEREFVLRACMLIKLRMSLPSCLLCVSWHGVWIKSSLCTPMICEGGWKKKSIFHTLKAFDFTQPLSWPAWRQRFTRFRIATKDDKEYADVQVNSLLYAICKQAEAIFRTFTFSVEEENDYCNTVVKKVWWTFCAQMQPESWLCLFLQKESTKQWMCWCIRQEFIRAGRLLWFWSY